MIMMKIIEVFIVIGGALLIAFIVYLSYLGLIAAASGSPC